MEVTGKLVKKVELLESGVSKSSGKEWKKAIYRN